MAKSASTIIRSRKRARKAGSPQVKLADVAKLAGVSTASASRALNFPDAVSGSIRQKVEVAAAQLNWIPNGAAKALASLRSGTVGALIPSLSHQNFATLVEALQDELAGAGYTLFLGCWGFSQDRELKQALKMIERGVEFIVLLGEAHSQALYDALRNRNVGYVVTFTHGREGTHPCVGFDNYQAFAQCVDHLLDLGHTRFGIIAQQAKDNDRIQQRLEAARDTLARKGLAIRPQHFKQTSTWNIGDGRTALREIMETDESPTAVICTNDYLAAGAVIEARAMGLEIPFDLSITGFDDIELAWHSEPPLTTVRVPDHEMGRLAAQFAIDVLSGSEPEIPAALQAEFVIRGSSGPPPVSRVRE